MLYKARKIIDINRKTLKKVKNFLGVNQKFVIRIGILAVSCALIPEIGFAKATMAMPGMDALDTFGKWVTGPLPTAVGTIAIGTSGAMLVFGEMGPAAKKTMQVVMGAGCALQAPNLVTLAGSAVSGLLF